MFKMMHCTRSGLCESVYVRAIMSVQHHKSNNRDAASVLFLPHRQAGRRVAACLTAHCACPRHLPCLLDVGGGEGLQQGREDPNGNPGRAGRETKYERKKTAFRIGSWMLQWKQLSPLRQVG